MFDLFINSILCLGTIAVVSVGVLIIKAVIDVLFGGDDNG